MADSEEDLPIIIIGAGFGGLLLAQGLRKHGIPFQLFEREQLSDKPSGHRFRIAENGTEALYETVPDDLSDLFTQTCPKLIERAPTFLDPRTLVNVHKPTRPAAPGRSPSAVDRTWILSLLSLNIEDRIHRGKKFVSYEVHSNAVIARFADGTEIRGKLLVGADGIHSQVRAQLQPDRKLLDMERQMIWGRTTMTPEVEERFPEKAQRWTALMDQQNPSRNVILEPIVWERDVSAVSNGRLPKQRDYVYWALIAEVPSAVPRTPQQIKEYVMSVTHDWDPDLCSLFELADWDLAARAKVYSSGPDIGEWPSVRGLVTLIGDAAHPMSPQGGLGGNTVALVVADLSRTLGKDGVSPESIAGFEERMRIVAKQSIDVTFATAKFMCKGKEWNAYREVERR